MNRGQRLALAVVLIFLALGLAIATDRLYMFFTVFIPIGVVGTVVHYRTGRPKREED